MSRGATFYVANPLYHGASDAGLSQQQQNLVPSYYVPPSQHYMPGVVPIGYIHAGQVPMQPPFVPAQPYVPPPIRESQPSSRFRFSFSSIWRSFRSLFNVGSDRNDLEVPDDNQPLVSEEREERSLVTLEHLPQNKKASIEVTSDVEQPSGTEETESPTAAEQTLRFSFSLSAIWMSVRSIFKKKSHRSTLEFSPDDEPILSKETEEGTASDPNCEHWSKDRENFIDSEVPEYSESNQKDVYKSEPIIHAAPTDTQTSQKPSKESDELPGEPKKLTKESHELPHEPQADKRIIKKSDAPLHDQCYPMREMAQQQTETSITLAVLDNPKNDESFSEYTYIDDVEDEPLILSEEESIMLSHLEAKVPELSVSSVDQQNPVQYYLDTKVPINDSQSVAGIKLTPGEESIGAQAKQMALPSPDDMEPLANMQLDTRLTQKKETETFQNKYEEQTASHPTSRENQSHDDITKSTNNHCAEETASQLYIVEKETIAIATMKSTTVVHTMGTKVQPTEKLAESKGYQYQLLKGTMNTKESTNKAKALQPNREINFELTDGLTGIGDELLSQDYISSSEKKDGKNSKWKTATAEDKKPIIESDVCLPCGDSTSAISGVKNPSPMGKTTISEVQSLQGKLETFTVADTTMTTSQNKDDNAGVMMDMERRFKGDQNVHVVTNCVTRMSSSSDVIGDQQKLVPMNEAQTIPAPTSTTVDQQIGDALEPMRNELMKRKESAELLKGPKIHLQKQSMPLEDRDVRVEEITQGSNENHNYVPHDSVISITGLHIQGDSMNKTMGNTMNVTVVSDVMNAPMDTAIEISQAKAVTVIDGNESGIKVVQNMEKSEKTLEQKINEVMPKEDRRVYRDLVTTIDKLFVDSEKRCCTCTCTCGCCIQSCCFSLSCMDMQNCLKKGPDNVEVNNITTKALQEGNRVGWKMFNELVFPLIDRRLFKFLITGLEIILGFIGFMLSCISFSLGNNAVYNIIHFIFAFLATAFGFLDFFISLSSCMTETCCKSKSEKLKLCAAKPCCCCTFGDILKGWDVIRILVNELLFYPLLICDMIEFIVDKGYKFQAENGEDVLSLFLFFHSSISLVFYVYILRLILLISMIYHLHKKRTLSPKQKDVVTELVTSTKQGIDPPIKLRPDSNEDELDPKIAKDAMKFQGYFVYHVAGQMAAQILMIAAVCLKIHKDNEFKTLDDPIYISNELWFMLIAGGVMPLFGILTFFIPTFYWVYEYPCGICIDMLSILETPGFGHIICYGEETGDMKEKVMNIAKRLNKDQLKKDFLDLHNKAFSSKIGYAFKNPILVVLCLFYSIFQLVFVIVAIVGIQSGAPDTVFFYILSIVVGFAANLYVFLVAAFWMTIIIGILILIAVVIALIILVILLLSCGGSNSNNRRSYI